MSTPPIQPAGKFRVLIIEDDADNAHLLAAHLRLNGLECHCSADGKSGLDAFHRLKPHLVLLDLMMPVLNGYEVCSHIRACSTVPIIMITAKVTSEEQVQGFLCGADDYVAKPFESALLLARITAQLRRVYRYDTPSPRAQLQDDQERTVAESITS